MRNHDETPFTDDGLQTPWKYLAVELELIEYIRICRLSCCKEFIFPLNNIILCHRPSRDVWLITFAFTTRLQQNAMCCSW